VLTVKDLKELPAKLESLGVTDDSLPVLIALDSEQAYEVVEIAGVILDDNNSSKAIVIRGNPSTESGDKKISSELH
jgi:hypothetical protein